MSAVFITALLITAAALSEKTGEDVFDTLPFVMGCGILLLYVLAFFRALPAAGWIAGVVMVGVVISGHGDIRAIVKDAQFWLAILLMLAVAVLASDRVVVWWDDLNFWANDAKSLWYLHGFAGKYGNVSPAFGDYPPVLSLWKWLFLSLSPSVYREGLQFSAYHVLNMIFLLPLLKVTRGFRYLWMRLLAVPAVFLLPGAVCGLLFTGAAADVTMGCVFGALLLAMREKDAEITERFRCARIAVYASILVLTKNTGIAWAVLAVIFWLFMCRRSETNKVRQFLAFCFSVIAWVSWSGFCLINRRVAKLTGEAVRMARQGTTLPEETGAFVRAFYEAFFLRPMHEHRNLTLDLSAGVMWGIFIITCVIVMLRGSLRFLRLTFFIFLSGFFVYGGILLSHLTVFRTELQYLESYNMSLSIARYGAPFLLGSVMVLLKEVTEILRTRVEKQGNGRTGADVDGTENGFDSRAMISVCVALPLLAFVFLTADYAGELHAFFTYRQTRTQDLQVREETIDEEGKVFLADMEKRQDLWGRRVLFLRDPGTQHGVKDVYISYEACPVAVVFEDAAPDMDADAVEQAASRAHAWTAWKIEKDKDKKNKER